jgi:two-component system response regulator YesN
MEGNAADPSMLPRTVAEQALVIENRLTEAIVTFDKAAVSTLLEQLVDVLRESGLPREDAIALLIELIVGVSRRLSDLCGEPILYMKELISNIPLCGTLEEMNSLLGSSLMDYAARMTNASAREDEAHSIRKAMDYIAGRFHHDLSIDEVSEFIGLSCSHFCVLFKKENGVTFLEYLTKLRIERAASILRNTDVKVYQIAPLVGYQDAKYFTQVFKRIMDMTPSEYRTMVHSDR